MVLTCLYRIAPFFGKFCKLLPRRKPKDPLSENSADAVNGLTSIQGRDNLNDGDAFKDGTSRDELVSQEPDIEKWSLSKRIVFALALAAGLWVLIALLASGLG